jgi:hypothetical protein
MIRWIASFSIILFISVACKKNKSDDGCYEEKYEYLFSNNKQIDTTHHIQNVLFANVVNGSDVVFTYRYTSRTCPNIADDGYVDLLIFQVPVGSTSFEYDTPVELQDNKCYFMHSCFCPIIASRIVTGTIKGTRIVNNKWSVQVNVTEPASGVQLSFNKQFQLE